MRLIGNLFEPGTPEESDRMEKLLGLPRSKRQSGQVGWCMEGLGMTVWLRLRDHYLNATLNMGRQEGTFGT